MYSAVKRLLLGPPIASAEEHHHRLIKIVLKFLDELDAEDPDDLITVVIPEFVVTKWYTQVLHNQTALALKGRLLFRPHTVVTSVPILVD